jgi:hypothetical protein
MGPRDALFAELASRRGGRETLPTRRASLRESDRYTLSHSFLPSPSRPVRIRNLVLYCPKIRVVKPIAYSRSAKNMDEVAVGRQARSRVQASEKLKSLFA